MLESSRTPAADAARAAEVLGGMKDAEVQRMLKDKIKAQVRPNRHLITAYSRHDPQPADLADIIFDAMSKRPSPILLADVLGLIGDLDPTPNWAESWLINSLGQKNYHAARRSAADSLGKCGSAAAVDALIPLINDKVIGLEARSALTRLTGQEYWRDASGWTSWWATAKNGFQPAKLADVQLKPLVEKLDEADDMNLDFYGVKLEGQHILFLLDSSGSMQGARIETLKRELRGLLHSMDESYQFGMVLFPMDKFPSRGIEPATEKFKEKAYRFIDRMSAAGGTPLTDAVEYAFEKVIEEHNVDTIYILTDGAPSKPEEDVRIMIQDYNEMALSRIHTISIGQDSDFLMNVAIDNGGNYAEVQ
ncbi:MAG: VWA domain-containing protein [Verrucomicrobiota bacterium]